MKRLSWGRNYDLESRRGKDQPEYEWWSAEWFVLGCHVHNKNGAWTFVIRGVKQVVPKQGVSFASREEACDEVERVIGRYASYLEKAPE